MKVNLTPKAIEKVTSFMEQEKDKPEIGLRIYVEGGGCSGFQYGFKLDEKKDGDHVFEFETAKVYIDPFSAPYIKESMIDYNDGLTNAGFLVQNPNSKTTCGCGLSFSV